MWCLRKPNEISEITCIPVNEPFTVGRIESSLNITDDKSVSRRHASISLASPNPVVSDCNSKFGTFVNGLKLESGSTVSLKPGDSIKFGGAGSEYLLEFKNMAVFYKTGRSRELRWIEEVSRKFGFEVVKNVEDASFFVLDDGDVDCDVAAALLLGKCIVAPEYLRPLQQTTAPVTFSVGLIQPTLPGYPADCWLPRRERMDVFRSAFEGISRFLLDQRDSRDQKIVETVARILGIETRTVTDHTALKFNELLVIFSLDTPQIDQSLLTSPIRTVSYQSLLDALIRSDSSLIAIETVYPEIRKKDRWVDSRGDSAVDSTSTSAGVNVVHSVVDIDSDRVQVVNEQIAEAVPRNIDEVYTGPSKTAVLPMPASFIRTSTCTTAPINPSTSTASTNPSSKPSKFVKCHPRHHQPGTIPALIGPDQLTPTSSILAASASSNDAGVKRRMLVKDSWLDEDEGRGDEGVRVVKIKENLSVSSRNTLNTLNASSTAVKAPSVITSVPPNIPQSTPHPISNIVSSSTTSTTNIASNTAISTTKFQSSFFKNLSKDK